MVGRITVSGTAGGAGGSDPFNWSSDDNQGLTLVLSEGIGLDVNTGIFTILPGYAGDWFFCWSFSVTGTGNATQTHELIADPLGAATVAFSHDRKLGGGGDVGVGLLQGIVAANVGDTFRFRMTNDAAGQYDNAYLSAYQISADL